MKQLVFLFGRTPLLSRAEIDRLTEIGLLEATVLEEFTGGIIVGVEHDIEPSLFSRLGGTIRVAELEETYEQFLPESLSGKFTFGFSYFGVTDWRTRRNKDTETVRSVMRSRGISTRFIASKSPEIQTAAVRGNKLLQKGAEFVICKANGKERVAKTVFIHDIDAYTSRDRARPSRDAKVGMLPPKLAQILVNLGVGAQTNLIWDPMVGTGVLLQEALLAGYRVIGSDSSDEMVRSARENLSWIQSTRSGMPEATIFEHDISSKWPDEAETTDAIISEGYLGPALYRQPSAEQIRRLEEELRGLYRPFFSEAASRLSSGCRIVICLPFFKESSGKKLRMGFVDELASNTYTLHGIYDYAPHGQVVGRQVTIFQKV